VNRSDKPKPKKLNGDGNFTDFTPERLEKYRQEGVRLLVAGFVDGELVYVLEVPFESLCDRLQSQLDKAFPQGREKGKYLRSANFSFQDYQDDERVECRYLNPQWRQFVQWCTESFQKYLERFEGGCDQWS